MFDEFKKIGKKYGPFNASLIEVGSYDPSWPDVHLGPEQAVKAHLHVRGGVLLPVHWSTFNLAIHGWTEPVERVLKATQKENISVAIPRPGQSIEPAHLPQLERWWPELPWDTAEEQPIISTGLTNAIITNIYLESKNS